MVCPRCGRMLPDGAQCMCFQAEVVLSSNPAVNILKKVGSSPMFLVAAICHSASILLSLLSSLFMWSGGNTILSNIIPDYAYYFEYGSYYDTLSNINLMSTFTGSIPSVLIAISLWLIYTACKDRCTGGVATTGFTIAKVISIIFVVISSLGVAAVLLSGVILVIFSLYELNSYSGFGYYLSPEFIVVLLVIMLAMLLALLVVMIIYYAMLVKTINRIKATAYTGIADNRISGFVIVFGYIFSVLTVLGGCSSLFAIQPVLGISAISSGVAAFLVSMCLSNYKKSMNVLMYEEANAYAAPQAGSNEYPVHQATMYQPISAPTQPAYTAPQYPSYAEPTAPFENTAVAPPVETAPVAVDTPTEEIPIVENAAPVENVSAENAPAENSTDSENQE